jgi:PIN domain nuclease of toxin-antitoxin system
MTLLVDTHVFLWYLMADPRLHASAQTLVADPANQLFLSRASLWEIGIKVSIGKLTLPAPYLALIPQKLQQTATQILDIQHEHIAAVIGIPFHHRDPFDSMLAAQALVEQMPILSADAIFDLYPVKRMW